MKIANDVTELIGNTPLVRLHRVTDGAVAEVVAKLEYYNPAHSVKDRIGVSMIEAAEKAGKIKPDTIIIEPTSGNTGIALAFVCAAKGYKLVLTMPETMSKERRMLLARLWRRIDPDPWRRKAWQGRSAKRRSWQPPTRVTSSLSSSKILPTRKSTAGPLPKKSGAIPMVRSIFWWRGSAPAARLPVSVKCIKQRKPSFKVIAVEPDASPVLSGGQKGPHPIQGIGAGFVPEVLNTKIYDEIIRVKNDDAFDIARRMAT